jgi:hypothetical protein
MDCCITIRMRDVVKMLELKGQEQFLNFSTK